MLRIARMIDKDLYLADGCKCRKHRRYTGMIHLAAARSRTLRLARDKGLK